MAAALLRYYFPRSMFVSSVGVRPGEHDPFADVVREEVGLSISDPGQMRAADLAAADYLGVGPVYPTGSKADAAPALGVAGLAGLRAMTGLPIIAIGGLTADNSGPVLAAGADGVAVVSALMLAADPAAAAASFRAARR